MDGTALVGKASQIFKQRCASWPSSNKRARGRQMTGLLGGCSSGANPGKDHLDPRLRRVRIEVEPAAEALVTIL